MPAGRPTKLTPALITKAKAFLKERSQDRMMLPTIEGLALRLNVNQDTIHDWITKEEQTELQAEFSEVVRRLKSAQAEKLVQNGLRGTYNATIAKLILSGKHGYVEKSEVDQNVSGNVSFVNDVPRPKHD